MGIENITERILSDAREKASEIENEANKKAVGILEEAEQKAESLKSKIILASETDGKEEKRRILAFARLEARNSILAEKQKAVDLVFQKALSKLLSLPDKEYSDLIKRLLLKTVSTGEEEVIFSPKDKKRISKELVEIVNETLKADGRKGALKISDDTREIEGGFILRSKGIEVNNSFSSMLALLREESEFQILQMLIKE